MTNKLHEWQLQEAKNKLSQVVNFALHKGPQFITLRGKSTAVLLSIKDYKKLVRPKVTLSEFLRRSPLLGVSLDITRSKDFPRDVDL